MDFRNTDLKDLFGAVAAEDDELKNLEKYFFKNQLFRKAIGKDKLLILKGYKGTGKSALLTMVQDYFYAEKKVCLSIKPDDFPSIKLSNNDNLDLISSWKKDLNDLIIKKAYETFLQEDKPQKKFFNAINAINDIFNLPQYLNADTDGFKKKIAENFNKNREVYVFIDDLERGWNGDENSIHRISSLISALRDLSNSFKGLKFRVSLRSDMYSMLRYDDSNLDKVLPDIFDVKWTRDDLLKILVMRVQHYFGNDIKSEDLDGLTQTELEPYLKDIMKLNFSGKGKWHNRPIHNILLSLIRERPRDLINLCTLAASKAGENNHDLIETKDWETIFQKYSRDRFNDTITEHKYQLSQDGVKQLLNGMKTTKAESKLQKSLYDRDEILLKIKNILEQNNIRKNGTTYKMSSKEGLEFLYSIGFLVARKDESENGYINRVTYDQNQDLVDQNSGYKFEIHPAFRWALNYDPNENILAGFDSEYY
ncbi:P-loop ATPase, Sll1717 family [Pseudolactococcus chungangensis]|nr:hypothetical protein [Lactococcus chungangensis]